MKIAICLSVFSWFVLSVTSLPAQYPYSAETSDEYENDYTDGTTENVPDESENTSPDNSVESNEISSEIPYTTADPENEVDYPEIGTTATSKPTSDNPIEMCTKLPVGNVADFNLYQFMDHLKETRKFLEKLEEDLDLKILIKK